MTPYNRLPRAAPINLARHAAVNLMAGIALTLGISGCVSYQDIHNNNSPRAIDTFAAADSLQGTEKPPSPNRDKSTENFQWPTDTWWTAFGDAQLNALIDEALAYNPSLDAAVARVHAALAYSGTARAALYPQIDGAADIQYQHFSETWEFPPPFGGSSVFNNTLQINAAYEVDFWGKNRSGVKAAVASEKAAEAEQQSAKLLLTSAVAKTYIELQRQYTLHDVAEQTLQQRTTIFALTQQRVDAGIDSKAELKQAEAQLPALRGQLAKIDETLGALRNALAALVGAGPDRGLQIQRPQFAPMSAASTFLPADLPVELLGRRPDIVASRWRVEAAQRDTDVAKAQFYPNVNLNGFIGFYSLGLDNLTRSESEMYSIGPAVSLPIFAGGRLRANLTNKYAAYDNAVAAYDQALTDALHDVADQLNAARWLQVQQREQQQALAIARSAQDLAMQRYQAGLGNYLSVLSVETLVLTQQQRGAELDARAFDLQVNLIKALGGGFNAQEKTAYRSNQLQTAVTTSPTLSTSAH